MRAPSNPAIARFETATLALLLLALASTLACASGGCQRNDYRGAACRARAAREALVFGLSRDAALDAMGHAEVEPPWKNDRGLGPASISNPFDSETFRSSLGEAYEVVRYFVEARGNPRCPFVQGELRLEPLIFVEDELVGWKWSYLEDVLGRRLSAKETRWEFGAFCDTQRARPTDSKPPDPEPPDAKPSDADLPDAEPSDGAGGGRAMRSNPMSRKTLPPPAPCDGICGCADNRDRLVNPLRVAPRRTALARAMGDRATWAWSESAHRPRQRARREPTIAGRSD